MKRIGATLAGCYLGGISLALCFSVSESALPLIIAPISLLIPLLFLFRGKNELFLPILFSLFILIGIQRVALSERFFTSRWETYLTSAGERIRERVGEKIERSLSSDESRTLAKSLLIGDRRSLSRSLRSSFTAAGVSHTLALSGMHVGIIWSLISITLSFLGISRRLKMVRAVFVSLIILFYALITGFSPSVSRACIMLSIWKIGDLISTQKSRFSSIILAAVLICSINPYALTNIGFQLSFCSVLGIIALFPTIEKSIKILLAKRIRRVGGRVAHLFLSTMAISLICQIATLPIVLWRFGSISANFLISNIVTIPLVTVSIYTTTASAFLQGLPLIGSLLSTLAENLLSLLAQVVRFLGS